MSKMKTLLSDLTQVLYELDIAGTSCKENELFDEYEEIARSALLFFISEDFPTLSECVEAALNEAFAPLPEVVMSESANDSIDALITWKIVKHD